MAARRSLRVALALLALTAASCVQDDGKRFNPIRQMTEVSVEEERSVGAKVDRQVRESYALIQDPVVLGFVTELGQSIVEQTEPQPFLYRFRVIPEPSLNAFAVPGGYVYFFSETVLAAGSLEELAGVMAHEVAHVKAHHYARLKQQSALPKALATLAGIGAAAATGEPGFVLAGQGVGEAVALQYTRELEAEADDLAASFMARSGYDLDGLPGFFEQLQARKRSAPAGSLPPYLRSHPLTEARIEAAKRRAERLSVTGSVEPEMRARFRAAQTRLAYLMETGKTRLRTARSTPDRAATEPLLAKAKRLAEAGEREAALERLQEAEAMAPADPSLPFRRGELLEEAGRLREAVAAWRRALQLDPEVALVWMRLGLAYKALGERHAAAFYLEQAMARAERGGRLARHAEQALHLLTFPPLRQAGLAARSGEGDAEALVGSSRERFEAGGAPPVWWAEVAPRYLDFRERIRVRWIGPSGATVHEADVEAERSPLVRAALDPETAAQAGPGAWRVEAHLEGSLIDRRRFRMLPAGTSAETGDPSPSAAAGAPRSEAGAGP